MHSLLVGIVLGGAGAAYAHVVSISSGELRVEGRTATYELRIPAYELDKIAKPEVTLLDHVTFEGARRSSSSCADHDGTYTCHATYEFDAPVTDTITVECTLFQVTAPNHVHMLYAALVSSSDQKVLDQASPRAEIRFRPASSSQWIAKDAAAGIERLFRSVAGLLFLATLALAAKNIRAAGSLILAFLAGEWLARPLFPHVPLAFSPEFLEAVLALTVAYLAAEVLLLPESRARWMAVLILGLAHGLSFAPFPASYLTAAQIVQAATVAMLWFAARKIPRIWRPRAAGVLLAAGLGWFARVLLLR